MKNEKDQLIELSPKQQPPANARPEDFAPEDEILEGGDQCGDNPREYQQLLRGGPRGRRDPRADKA